MASVSFTIIDGAAPVTVPAIVGDGRVRLSAESVDEALGWQLEPEGLCRAGTCVPVRAGAPLVTGEGIDLSELAAALGRPLALDLAERAACLGASAGDRAQALDSLQAPDWELPDLHGRMHRLSEHRGKKVFLVAYASW
jgi:hypothetical protein